VQLAGKLGHAPLEPPALGLQRERVRVAVGERALEPREGRRLFCLSRFGEQLVDLLEECGYRLWSHYGLVPDYQTDRRTPTRAARPIRPHA
jgi:hypothetical protein